MKKILRKLMLITMVLSLFTCNVFAMLPVSETPSDILTVAKATDLASYEGYGFGFIPDILLIFVLFLFHGVQTNFI